MFRELVFSPLKWHKCQFNLIQFINTMSRNRKLLHSDISSPLIHQWLIDRAPEFVSELRDAIPAESKYEDFKELYNGLFKIVISKRSEIAFYLQLKPSQLRENEFIPYFHYVYCNQNASIDDAIMNYDYAVLQQITDFTPETVIRIVNAIIEHMDALYCKLTQYHKNDDNLYQLDADYHFARERIMRSIIMFIGLYYLKSKYDYTPIDEKIAAYVWHIGHEIPMPHIHMTIENRDCVLSKRVAQKAFNALCQSEVKSWYYDIVDYYKANLSR